MMRLIRISLPLLVLACTGQPAGRQDTLASQSDLAATIGANRPGARCEPRRQPSRECAHHDECGCADEPPVITSLWASRTSVALGDRVFLLAMAKDDDRDPISFRWSVSPAACGTFIAPDLPLTTWTARAAGTCTLTVTATANHLSSSKSVSIAVRPGAAAPANPTLVQHLSSSAESTGRPPGNAFKFTLPNPVLAGNCLILGITYQWSAARTVAITDSNGNTWPTSAAATANDGWNRISSIYVLPNAKPGVTTVTVTFDDAVQPFQYTISEFYNVAQTSPVNGTASNDAALAPSLSSGTFTPGNNDANGGNLIWTYAYDNSGVYPVNAATNFAPANGFTLLDADIAWGLNDNQHHASEYFVQTAAAPIEPGFSAAMTPASDTFNVLSVALKAASAGTAPPASGIRIVRCVHFTNEMSPAPSIWNLQFPSQGNLVVLATIDPTLIPISGVTDSKGNSYTLENTNGSAPQFWFAANATPDPNLSIALALSGPPAGTSLTAYDIVGAASSPFDVVAGVGQTLAGPGEVDDFPAITPTSTNGLTIAALQLGQGPGLGLAAGAPAAGIFDFVSYTGEIDLDTMDNADGRAHVYNTDLSTEHWNWDIALETSVSATAVHFHGAR
jgi:hypothetical protein